LGWFAEGICLLKENPMLRKTLFAPLLAASVMALAVAAPAHAGKADRAREAIAAADAKIHTAETLGAGSKMPHQTAEARAALDMAKEKLAAGDKSTSINEAIRASSLADTAIGEMQKRQEQSISDERQARADSVAAAQQQTALAQQQAASAQRSAAISAGEATAARNQAIMAAPAQVETTVTTEPASAGTRSVARTSVTRTTKPLTAPPAGVTTTTTTIQPGR
jgi:hypothetical protein